MRDIIRLAFLIGPTWLMAWWDNWSYFQLFVVWDLGFIILILTDIRRLGHAKTPRL